MIANVQLSIDYIGGNTLAGPINRLQNAVSFNYYANTEIYDVRSDSVVDGQLIEGLKLSQLKQQLVGNETLSEIYDGLQKSDTLNQIKENEETDDTDDDGVTDNSFLEMFINGANEIISKTKNGKPVNELGLKPEDKSKELFLRLKVGDLKKEIGPTTNGKILNSGDVYSLFPKLAKPEKILSGQTAVNNAQTELTNAENAYKANRSSNVLRKKVQEKQKVLTDKQLDLKTYLDSVETEIKTETYIQSGGKKTIKKTKIKKTFTVTENGIN